MRLAPRSERLILRGMRRLITRRRGRRDVCSSSGGRRWRSRPRLNRGRLSQRVRRGLRIEYPSGRFFTLKVLGHSALATKLLAFLNIPSAVRTPTRHPPAQASRMNAIYCRAMLQPIEQSVVVTQSEKKGSAIPCLPPLQTQIDCP